MTTPPPSSTSRFRFVRSRVAGAAALGLAAALSALAAGGEGGPRDPSGVLRALGPVAPVAATATSRRLRVTVASAAEPVHVAFANDATTAAGVNEARAATLWLRVPAGQVPERDAVRALDRVVRRVGAACFVPPSPALRAALRDRVGRPDGAAPARAFPDGSRLDVVPTGDGGHDVRIRLALPERREARCALP